MKTLFRGFFSFAVVVILCITALCSCDKEEKYDFKFEAPGRIYSKPGATQVIPFIAHNITSMSVSSKPKGWNVDKVDMQNWTITVTAPDAYSDDTNKYEENGLLKVTGYTAAGTVIYISSYLSLQNKAVDITDIYSNSYIISEPDTRYVIDVTHIGETSQKIAPADAKILWQSDSKLINYCEFKPEDGTFSFFVGSKEIKDSYGRVEKLVVPEGNAVVAAYDNDGNILWSWHLWLTPEIVEENLIVASADVFMDRNLGAYSNSAGS